MTEPGWGAPGQPDRRAAFRWPAERRPSTPISQPEQPAPGSWPWKRWVKWALLVGGAAAALAILLAPLPDGLTRAATASAAVFLLCTVLWITNVVPFGVTGLLAVALLGLLGAMRPADAFAAFGNSAVFFLIGVFLIGGALVDSGLSKRSALLFLRRFERSPQAFATGLMLAAAFGTLWMPNQATTAMLFPIAVEIVTALRLVPRSSSYAKVLFLSLAWGAMIGSNASMLGSTRAALALGMLRDATGETISFSQWVVAAAPAVILALAVAPLILRACFPPEPIEFASARTMLERAVDEMGPVNQRQWRTGIIVVLTVASWILLGERIDLAVIALLGATALFAARTLTWEDAERRIFWNIVLMYGGAIALGAAIDQTGAAEWFVTRTIGDLTIPPLLAVGLAALAALVLSEFMSNAAAVAVILPLAFSLGSRTGVSPIAMTLATSIGAGLDFALPFSSAPNTIAFASGYLRMSDVLKAGGWMTLASAAIVMLVAWIWWPLLGLV